MIHMLKSRDSAGVLTRCGALIKLKSGQSIRDIGVTGKEPEVTCPGCTLKGRT